MKIELLKNATLRNGKAFEIKQIIYDLDNEVNMITGYVGKRYIEWNQSGDNGTIMNKKKPSLYESSFDTGYDLVIKVPFKK